MKSKLKDPDPTANINGGSKVTNTEETRKGQEEPSFLSSPQVPLMEVAHLF